MPSYDEIYGGSFDPEVTTEPRYLALSENNSGIAGDSIYSGRAIELLREIRFGYPAGATGIPYTIPALHCSPVHAALMGIHLASEADELGRIFNYIARHFLDQNGSRPLLTNPQLSTLMYTGLARIVDWEWTDPTRFRSQAAAMKAYDAFVRKLCTNFQNLQVLRTLAEKQITGAGGNLGKFVPDKIAEKVLHNYCEYAMKKCVAYIEKLDLQDRGQWIVQRDLVNGLFPVIFQCCDTQSLDRYAGSVATQIQRLVSHNTPPEHQQNQEYRQDPGLLMERMMHPNQILVSLCRRMKDDEIRNSIVPIVSSLIKGNVLQIINDRGADRAELIGQATRINAWLDHVFKSSAQSDSPRLWPEALGSEIFNLFLHDGAAWKFTDDVVKEHFQQIVNRCRRPRRERYTDTGIAPRLLGKPVNSSTYVELSRVQVLNIASDLNAKGGALVELPLDGPCRLLEDLGQPRGSRLRIEKSADSLKIECCQLVLLIETRTKTTKRPCRIAREHDTGKSEDQGRYLGLSFE